MEQCVPCGAGLHGPFAGCRWRVLLSKGCLHFRNLGAATGCCCESAVCAMKLGCMASLQGGGCEMSKAWAFGLDGDYVYVAKKGERLVATKKTILLSGVACAISVPILFHYSPTGFRNLNADNFRCSFRCSFRALHGRFHVVVPM